MTPRARLLHLVLIAILALGCSSAFQRRSPYPIAAYSGGGEERLEVLAQGTGGDHLSGVTLVLCPIADGRMRTDLDCSTTFTDSEGLATFEGIEPGLYQLKANMGGFVDTAIGPLRFDSGDPIPPLRVVLAMNPVCYDCRGYVVAEPEREEGGA